jgi:hypothetical protein
MCFLPPHPLIDAFSVLKIHSRPYVCTLCDPSSFSRQFSTKDDSTESVASYLKTSSPGTPFPHWSDNVSSPDQKINGEASTISSSNSTVKSSNALDSSVLAIDPAEVSIVTLNTSSSFQGGNTSNAIPLDLIRHLPFVNMFRGSANYIANHRNTLSVYHIPGGLLDLPDPTVFRDLMNDVALTWLLGMRIVLVVGCRYQIEKRLAQHPHSRVVGLRVTDQETLRIVKEEAGFVRFEVERQVARSLRMQSGGDSGASGKQGYYDGNVVSGNFYSAQPMGILDGVDYRCV